MASEPSKIVSVAHSVVEVLAIVVGFVLTMISLMAIVGSFTDNLWVRLGVAAVVAILVPIIVTDRLLPEGEAAAKGDGLFTDVLAILWLGFGLVWMGVAVPYTHGMLDAEAERLDEQGLGFAATGIETIIGPGPQAQIPEAAEVAAGSDADRAEAGAAGTDAGNADAGVAETDAGDAGADQTDAAMAEADKKEESSEEDDKIMTPVELFKKLSPAVVSIEVVKQRGARQGRAGGTGFIIDDKGTMATNHHVIAGGSEIEVVLHDGTKISDVDMLAEDPRLDLALLRLNTDTELKTTELGDSDDIQVGERVVAIGNPLGLDYTMTDGLVSARRVWRNRKMIQMSVPVSPGNSGGPLFNMKGEVVGINTAQLGNAFNRGENLNLAVPINALKKNLISSKYPNRREFGEEAKHGSW